MIFLWIHLYPMSVLLPVLKLAHVSLAIREFQLPKAVIHRVISVTIGSSTEEVSVVLKVFTLEGAFVG